MLLLVTIGAVGIPIGIRDVYHLALADGVSGKDVNEAVLNAMNIIRSNVHMIIADGQEEPVDVTSIDVDAPLLLYPNVLRLSPSSRASLVSFQTSQFFNARGMPQDLAPKDLMSGLMYRLTHDGKMLMGLKPVRINCERFGGLPRIR